MPYIIKNGKTYTGNSVTLTQAQYDALSEAEKNNGVAYYIYDSDAVLDASDVGLGTGSVETLAGSVAVIETSPATAIHAVGDFILWNGQLYTVISRIEVGQALTVGSNITATNAGSEISELKAGLIVYRDYTATTGTSQYQGYYFADVSYVLAGYTLISASNFGATSNRPSFVQVVTASNIRAYSTVQETAVTIRCVYIKN